MCGWWTSANKWAEGDLCQQCNEGKLEHRIYQIDLAANQAIGHCGCEDFEMHRLPKLKQINVDNLAANERNELRCKHLKLARDCAREDDNLDALLLSLPHQD
jgi:hypothetical protein